MPREMCILDTTPHSIPTLNTIMKQRATYLRILQNSPCVANSKYVSQLGKCLTAPDSHLHSIKNSHPQLRLAGWQPQDRKEESIVTFSSFVTLRVVFLAFTTWRPWASRVSFCNAASWCKTYHPKTGTEHSLALAAPLPTLCRESYSKSSFWVMHHQMSTELSTHN